MSLAGLGDIARAQGDERRAAKTYAESLTLLRASDDTVLLIPLLDKVAALASLGGDPSARQRADVLTRAAQLFGAAARLREEIGASLLPIARRENERDVARVRTALGEEAFAAAWREGQSLSQGRAISAALDACHSYLP